MIEAIEWTGLYFDFSELLLDMFSDDAAGRNENVVCNWFPGGCRVM